MKRKYAILALIAAACAAIDRLTKYLVSSNFSAGESVPLINNFFHLTFVSNTGSAFGLFKGLNLAFILLSAIIIIALIYLSTEFKEKSLIPYLFLGLILGGILGNLIDRILYGFVIDFLDFQVWPVFNAADSFITIGAAGLIFIQRKK